MARNEHSTSGMGEDIIRSIVQFGATEVHLKTLIEKSEAELENGFIDPTDISAVEAQLKKLSEYTEELIEVAQLRRESMLYLFEMYDGDKDAWCLVKHLGIGAMTLFEAWQASDNDPTLYNMMIRANKAFVRAVTRFIGIEITSCSACLSDFLKAKGEQNETISLR